ncbi:hypothetical protein EJ08DRAFT_649710 [Tothia fuscella]|uniref:Zn(2)-C6 fungal-type domain-containing protein n=1 Tax=Tothia fuscella TaxID=1048955 RepID=A0A9P4NSF8_9PEZI|nr:hypothetical protein EJ08DRAFT_649710 [Tothia fuscella]
MKRSHREVSPDASGSNGASRSHQPKISRKIRACQECQSRKIKCGIEPGDVSCVRCQRLGLQCVVNKSLQTLLEDESEWKSSMEHKTEQLQFAVSDILRQLNLPRLGDLTPGTSTSRTSPSIDHFQERRSSRIRHVPHAVPMVREPSPDPTSRDEIEADKMAEAPMASLFEVTKLRNIRNNIHAPSPAPRRSMLRDDFLSQGKISIKDAEELFQQFKVSLSQYLWGGIALVHDNLTSVRESSSLLTASILAVTALHIPAKESIFEIAYSEFLALVSESLFETSHSLDDVRSSCIGAFWLSDVSWKLSGHAVRIATELHLHQSFSKVLRGQVEHFERAQLWYLLYVVDHHFSIAYGRPPVIHEDLSISCHETFLQVPGILQSDWRLHSQVAVFRILSRMYLHFGPDGDKALCEADFEAIRAFNLDFDAWRTRWEPRLAPNNYISSYPSRGVIMHWNFAKLQLNALALRGLSPRQAHLISDQRREFANHAIQSATGILALLLDEPSIRSSIIGVPLYLHTTITYACVFLLKVHLRWKAARLNIDIQLAFTLIERTAQLLASSGASEKHLAHHISRGLSSMLKKSRKGKLKCDPAQQATNLDMSTMPMFDTNTQEDWSGVDSGSDVMFGDVYSHFEQEFFPPVFFDMVTTQMPG